MATFWVTFRIADEYVDGHDDDDRRLMLYEAIRQASNGKWWKEPTSFVLFSSDLSIDAIAEQIRDAISPIHDIVLIREDGVKSARVVGLVEDEDLFEFMDYAQYA